MTPQASVGFMRDIGTAIASHFLDHVQRSARLVSWYQHITGAAAWLIEIRSTADDGSFTRQTFELDLSEAEHTRMIDAVEAGRRCEAARKGITSLEDLAAIPWPTVRLTLSIEHFGTIWDEVKVE